MRADGAFAAPAFTVVLLFTGLVVLPFTLYLYLAHPAWTWMYLVDPERVPGLAVVPLLCLHGGLLLGGYYLGARLVRAGKQRIAAYGAAGGGAVTLIAVIPLWGRLGRYGTYEEFWDGRALELMEVKLGYVMVVLVLGMAVAAGSVALELLRDSRRVRSR